MSADQSGDQKREIEQAHDVESCAILTVASSRSKAPQAEFEAKNDRSDPIRGNQLHTVVSRSAPIVLRGCPLLALFTTGFEGVPSDG
ncbi:MAG: hypothetical protein WB723_09730 [Candidatus Acidiferrales bacterium]